MKAIRMYQATRVFANGSMVISPLPFISLTRRGGSASAPSFGKFREASRRGTDMKQAQRRDVTKYRWADISEEELNPLLTRKLITGERVMLSELVLKKGCVVPAHQHENEQVSYVIRGKQQFELNEKKTDLHACDLLHFPSNVEHPSTALA